MKKILNNESVSSMVTRTFRFLILPEQVSIDSRTYADDLHLQRGMHAHNVSQVLFYCILNVYFLALAGVAQWVEHCPAKPKKGSWV